MPLLGECVLEEELVGQHPDYGDQDILYHARIFVVRLAAADAGRLDRSAVERAGYRSYRWWSLEELERTDETMSPRSCRRMFGMC